PRHTRTADSPAITTLRERIAQQYAAPFDAIFDSPAAAELGEVDRSRAIALLIGPLVIGRLSTLPDFDYRECGLAAVGGFLYAQRHQTAAAGWPATVNGTAASIESAGASGAVCSDRGRAPRVGGPSPPDFCPYP